MSDPDVIAALKGACLDFAALIRSLSDEAFLSPMEGWSPRDVTAHLVGWNELMVEAALSILAGKAPAYYADAPNDYRRINAGFTARHASRSKQELLAELGTSMETLEAFLLALPAGERRADHGVRHYSGVPATVDKIVVSLTGDYRHHADEIRTWLENR